MRRKVQGSMLALGIVMAFVVGVFWAGPVGAGDPCAALQMAAERLGCAGAPVEKTGQTKCYNVYGDEIDCTDTGQDGDLQKGVAWPEPRFTDNEDGTVTDNLTGLIWLQNANCAKGTVNWYTAIDYAAELCDGCINCFGTASDCGLSDDSEAGDWRLPNVKELQSLIHYGVRNPALPNTAGTGKWSEDDPFSGVVSSYYWSSTTYAGNPGLAWYVYLYRGYVHRGNKDNNFYVWPVRGGQ